MIDVERTSFITQVCVSVKLPSSVYFLTQIVAQPYPNVRVIQRSHAAVKNVKIYKL
jgi:hypothetical protein